MSEPDFDDPEDIEVYWRELLLRWSKVNALRLSAADLDEGEYRDLIREWWSQSSEILWFLMRASTSAGLHVSPAPASLFAEFARVAEDLGNGVSPPLIGQVSERGRKTYSVNERKEVSIALCYLRAVEEGRIEDRSPNKTVRNAFGVSRSTVKKWEEVREVICAGMPGADYTSEQLVDALKAAGELHKRNGRSQTAILNRGRFKTRT